MGSVDMATCQMTISSARRAPACLQCLEDRHQVARCGAHLVHRAHDLIEIHAGLEHEHARIGLLHVDVLRGVTVAVVPLVNGVGLAHILALGDGHRQRAVRDRGRHDLHVRADDDGAGARIDDDARRRLARLDLDRLRASRDRPMRWFGSTGRGDLDGHRIEWPRRCRRRESC